MSDQNDQRNPLILAMQMQKFANMFFGDLYHVRCCRLLHVLVVGHLANLEWDGNVWQMAQFFLSVQSKKITSITLLLLAYLSQEPYCGRHSLIQRFWTWILGWKMGAVGRPSHCVTTAAVTLLLKSCSRELSKTDTRGGLRETMRTGAFYWNRPLPQSDRFTTELQQYNI